MTVKDDMNLVQHLSELRKRIIWSLIILITAVVGGMFAANPIISYLKSQEPASEITWNAFSPWDGISIYMKFAFVIGLTIALPFLLFQLWSFVKPGLRPAEQKATLRYIPFAVLLFLVGMAFAYFVIFPLAFGFTSKVSQGLDLTETYGITQYFAFMFNIILPMSCLFELPILVMFLTRLRLLNPKRLRKLRKISYFVLILIATIVTPPDFISDILVAIPLLILYEISVMLSSVVHRKQVAADLAYEAEYG